jgi:hypothetical protein
MGRAYNQRECFSLRGMYDLILLRTILIHFTSIILDYNCEPYTSDPLFMYIPHIFVKDLFANIKEKDNGISTVTIEVFKTNFYKLIITALEKKKVILSEVDTQFNFRKKFCSDKIAFDIKLLSILLSESIYIVESRCNVSTY